MRSQYMRKEVGDGTVGFTEKPTVQLGSLRFLIENGKTRNRRTSYVLAKTNGENLLFSQLQ